MVCLMKAFGLCEPLIDRYTFCVHISSAHVGSSFRPHPVLWSGSRSRLRPACAGLSPEPGPLPLLCGFSRAVRLVPSQPLRGRNSWSSGPVSALRVSIACGEPGCPASCQNDLGSGGGRPKQAVSETTGIERTACGQLGDRVIRSNHCTRPSRGQRGGTFISN